MKKCNCKIAKKGKVGELSSKYGLDKNGKQFIADMNAHFERAEYLWKEFVEFMKSHEVVPSELRSMFVRYYEEYLK